MGVLILGLYLVGNVSALDYQYSEYWSDDSSDVVIVENYKWELHYDEDDAERYSVWDYRNGWSYRDKRVVVMQEIPKREVRDYRNYNYQGYDSDKHYDYVAVPYLNRVEVRECYDSAPRGKLFYIRCD